MDYQEAVQQVIIASEASGGLIVELRNGRCPSNEQLKSIMHALRCIYESVAGDEQLDRHLAAALYSVAFYSHEYANIMPQVTSEAMHYKEVARIDIQMAIESIFTGEWIEQGD